MEEEEEEEEHLWINRDYLEALYDVQRDVAVDALGEGRHRG